MLSPQITDILEKLRNGGSSAPILVDESIACDICENILEREVLSLDSLAGLVTMDLLYYDCADRDAKNHSVKNIREYSQKLHQKQTSGIMIAIFRSLENLTEEAMNALLRLFEDVPKELLIIVTSHAPEKILATLRSRMVIMSQKAHIREENPYQEAINTYLKGDPTPLFAMTLAPSKERKFTKDDALWVIVGLQDGIECGKLAPRHAKRIAETRLLLETTNTIAKYLIDQLLISLACE